MEKLTPPKYISAVRARPKLIRSLIFLGRALVLTVVGAFAVDAAALAYRDIYDLAAFLVFAAVPFLLVTLLRRVVSLPRPYEVYDITPPVAGARSGSSFPSRHVASAFLIGTLSLGVSLPLAVAVLVAAVGVAVIRVLLGIHFVRDVVAGAVLGTFGGLVPVILSVFVN